MGKSGGESGDERIFGDSKGASFALWADDDAALLDVVVLEEESIRKNEPSYPYVEI